MAKALIVIDLQNDYFPGGAYPLWNADVVLDNVVGAIAAAKENGVPVVLVQHIADTARGPAPFFNPGTTGVELHAAVRAAAPGAPVVTKSFADAFVGTGLAELLAELDVDGLLVCGMMTQNCVTHTAISRAAERFDVAVLTDCCTTVDELLHKLALNALSTRLTLGTAAELIPG